MAAIWFGQPFWSLPLPLPLLAFVATLVLALILAFLALCGQHPYLFGVQW